MQAQVKWIDSGRFIGTTGGNHSVVMDTDKDQRSAPSPMEIILLGVGGCSSVDVVGILKKARQKVQSCHVELEAERADTTPGVFTRIHLNFVVAGEEIKEAHVKRAVALSAEKYCSASIMLGNAGVKITHSYNILESKPDV